MRKLLVCGGVAAVAGLGLLAWRGPATEDARAPEAPPTTRAAGATAPMRRPQLAAVAAPTPAAPPELAAAPELGGIEAPPEVLAAFQQGEATLRSAARRCEADLGPAPAGAAVRFAVDVVVDHGRARSAKVEVLDRGGQSEAFDACLVNELADESWGAEIPDGKLTFEYTMELAGLARG